MSDDAKGTIDTKDGSVDYGSKSDGTGTWWSGTGGSKGGREGVEREDNRETYHSVDQDTNQKAAWEHNTLTGEDTITKPYPSDYKYPPKGWW